MSVPVRPGRRGARAPAPDAGLEINEERSQPENRYPESDTRYVTRRCAVRDGRRFSRRRAVPRRNRMPGRRRRPGPRGCSPYRGNVRGARARASFVAAIGHAAASRAGGRKGVFANPL
ncbi:hypothetical protein EGY16_32935 [Burkholderia pseudomallei]|nr:hypothetical protein EGY16_32935 [Burkholderia pseudomallei]PJO57106.1 hypothetical protein CWD85_23335 [Burkholderia pseudomallei]